MNDIDVPAPIAQSELVRMIGEALYGRQWYARLSDDLGLNRRRVQRWLAETDAVPDGVWSDLEELMEERQQQMAAALHRLRYAPEIKSPPPFQKPEPSDA